MPNYVRNRVRFEGDPAEIKRMLGHVRADNEGIGSIDFNRILPMPGSLNIEAGSRTDEGLAMYRGFMRAADGGRETGRFLRYREEHRESWELGKQAYENIRDHGFPTWYEWCTYNWGTKWNAIVPDGVTLSENELCFDTAWAYPEGVMRKLSALFPEIVFTIEWADEDLGNNCGRAEYSKGEAVGADIPAGKKEAVEFAASVWDADPEDWHLYPTPDGLDYEYRDSAPELSVREDPR